MSFGQVQTRTNNAGLDSIPNKINRGRRFLLTIKSKIEFAPTYTSSKVPFWFRSNNYGNIPITGPSIGIIAGFERNYARPKKKLFDYGFGFESRANIGNASDINIIEGYAKGRFWVFQLKAGRSKDFTGCVDSTLSSGAFSVSGNALGIPKIEISVPEFYTIPILWKLFAIKGSFSHGWLGEVSTKKKDVETYFHQKTFYGQFGRPNWRLKFLGGFNHQVFWGSEKEQNGEKWKQSQIDTYTNVVFGNSTRLKGVEVSKVGNALGTIDFGMLYDFKNFRIKVYRQFFYDVGALYYFANIRDGLTGITFINTKPQKKPVHFDKLLFEYFYSLDQAGYPWSTPTPSGDEDYYNNYVYTQGWSYNGVGLGNPFITTKVLARPGYDYTSKNYFVNNRVEAFHMGLILSVKKIKIISKISYSRNYGTFATSIYGRSTGRKKGPSRGLFLEVEQLSTMIEVQVPLQKNYKVGFAFAIDYGDLFYNSTGAFVKIGKYF